MQGGAVLLTGTLADHSTVPVVVGLWSIAGVGLMLVLVLRWPAASVVDREIEKAAEAVPPPAPRATRVTPARGSAERLAGWTGDRTR